MRQPMQRAARLFRFPMSDASSNAERGSASGAKQIRALIKRHVQCTETYRSRRRAAVQISARARLRRARLAPYPGLSRRDPRRVGKLRLAAQAHDQKSERAAT